MYAGRAAPGARRGPAPESRPAAPTAADGLATALALAFVGAAAIATLTRLSYHYDHGWWLVAYLVLVGGLAQLLLAPGAARVSPRAGATRGRWWALALWNIGTVLVPIGVFTDLPSLVLVGSAPLLVSLALYATAMRGRANAATQRSRGRELAYYTVVAGLGISVFVGAALNGALELP